MFGKWLDSTTSESGDLYHRGSISRKDLLCLSELHCGRQRQKSTLENEIAGWTSQLPNAEISNLYEFGGWDPRGSDYQTLPKGVQNTKLIRWFYHTKYFGPHFILCLCTCNYGRGWVETMPNPTRQLTPLSRTDHVTWFGLCIWARGLASSLIIIGLDC